VSTVAACEGSVSDLGKKGIEPRAPLLRRAMGLWMEERVIVRITRSSCAFASELLGTVVSQD
jgi:hypothetical protein